VSEAVKDKIKNGMPEKYEAIKDKLLEAENHPNEDDIELLMLELEKLL